MIINVKDNRIVAKRFIDLFVGDFFMYNGTVYIKVYNFYVKHSPENIYYNSIDINGNFYDCSSDILVSPIEKITLTVEE